MDQIQTFQIQNSIPDDTSSIFNSSISETQYQQSNNAQSQDNQQPQPTPYTHPLIHKLPYPETWEEIFKSFKHEIRYISKKINNDIRCPARENIYNAFHLTPLNTVKVVIIGQDPYHSFRDNESVSIGLAFSGRRNNPVPPSLKTIYKELESDLNIPQATHGDLTMWAKQGVLLLNMALTVIPGYPGSDVNMWSPFLYGVISAIDGVNPNCIYLLWGRNAQSVKKQLGDKAVILEAGHPSPMNCNSKTSFLGCGHFSEVNKILRSQRKEEINWDVNWDGESEWDRSGGNKGRASNGNVVKSGVILGEGYLRELERKRMLEEMELKGEGE